MGAVKANRFMVFLISCSFLLSSCSWGGDENLPYPRSLSDVEWDWERSDPEHGGRIIPVPGGVAVVWEPTIVVLSGETGREIWSYDDEENEAEEVRLSGNGDYLIWKVVLEELGVWEYGYENAEHWLADPVTGEIVHKIPTPGYVGRRLFAERLYVQEEQVGEGEPTRFAAYQLADGEGGDPVWTSEAHLRCETKPDFEVRNHDSVLVGNTVVIPYTCVEGEIGWRNEGPQTVVAGLLALDVESGEELWRNEDVLDEVALSESSRRELERVNDDYLNVYGNFRRSSRLLEARTGELVPDRGGAFAGPGSASWLVDDAGDDEYVRLGEGLREEARVDFSRESDRSEVVPLEDGLAVVSDAGTDPTAVFQPWDGESERVYVELGIAGHEVLDVESAPGAVVVLHEDPETGQLGLVGLA